MQKGSNENGQIRPLTRDSSAVVARVAMILAVVFAAVLLISNIPAVVSACRLPATLHPYFGSASLALAGFGYALLQITLRPSRKTLLKRLLLAATFAAWAVDQLLPPGRAAMLIGDAVIAAYVLDLFWITQEQGDASPRPEQRHG